MEAVWALQNKGVVGTDKHEGHELHTPLSPANGSAGPGS